MMAITRTIAVLNQMKADGVVKDYAIGGAVAATFHLEPGATLDVDVFIPLEPKGGSALLNMQPIFDYLIAQGHRVEGEYVHIEGWPVQFLPLADPLVEEALSEAVSTEVEGVPTRVFSAEHLVGIALQTGRPKDKARILQFLASGALDMDRLRDILRRHDLIERWQQFERTFLS